MRSFVVVVAGFTTLLAVIPACDSATFLPVGHWEGTLTIGAEQYHVALDLWEEAGHLTGTVDAREMGILWFAGTVSFCSRGLPSLLPDSGEERGALHFALHRRSSGMIGTTELNQSRATLELKRLEMNSVRVQENEIRFAGRECDACRDSLSASHTRSISGGGAQSRVGSMDPIGYSAPYRVPRYSHEMESPLLCTTAVGEVSRTATRPSSSILES